MADFIAWNPERVSEPNAPPRVVVTAGGAMVSVGLIGGRGVLATATSIDEIMMLPAMYYAAKLEQQKWYRETMDGAGT